MTDLGDILSHPVGFRLTRSYSYRCEMLEAAQQLRNLEELAAIANESSPSALARFYELLREVESAIRNIQESRL